MKWLAREHQPVLAGVVLELLAEAYGVAVGQQMRVTWSVADGDPLNQTKEGEVDL